MTPIMHALGDDARSDATGRHPIDALEIALTEDEIAHAEILQFDPDATLHPGAGPAPNGVRPDMLAVPGHRYSIATWTRLAMGALGDRPAEALARFIEERARKPA